MRKLFSFLLILMVLFAVGPAQAHHKETHDGGPRSEVGSPSGDQDDNRHPSGKDGETNDGPADDTQGHSPSDPDDDGRGPDRSNGGADKPGGPGGTDKQDQDGNNGCGNDDDFEDDNEGLCGGKPGRPDKAKPPGEHPGPDDVGDDEASPRPGPSGTGDVLGVRTSVSPSPSAVAATSDGATQGQAVDASADGAPLADTGRDITPFLLIASGLTLLGLVLLYHTRS